MNDSLRKVLVKFRRKQWDSVHEVMRFPLKEEEFAKIAEIDLQYPGNWFRLFSLNFIFLWKPCYFPISFLAVDQSLFPFFLANVL